LNFDTAKLLYSPNPHHTVVGVYSYHVYGSMFHTTLFIRQLQNDYTSFVTEL